MSIGTNFNIVEDFNGDIISVNVNARINILPANTQRIKSYISLNCSDVDVCVSLYDQEVDGNLIAILDRSHIGNTNRDTSPFVIDVNALYRGDVWAIVEIGGPPAYDLTVIEYEG